MKPTPVPTLDEVAADPQRAAELPGHVRHSLVLRGLAALAALTAAPAHGNGHQEEPEHAGGDRWLRAKEVAAALQVNVDSLYRMRLPFAVRTGTRSVRYSEQGLQAWLRQRRGRP